MLLYNTSAIVVNSIPSLFRYLNIGIPVREQEGAFAVVQCNCLQEHGDSMKVREMVKRIEADGWNFARRSSHRIYK